MAKRITYSKKRFVGAMNPSNLAKHLSEQNRPNKGTSDDILNFEHYFDKYIPKEGTINGPEKKDGKVYISVYHFLQYEGLDPEKYDTERIGLYLYVEVTKDVIVCHYENYEKDINKYLYQILVENMKDFEDFLWA